MAKYGDPTPDLEQLGFGGGARGHYWQLSDPEWLHDAHVNYQRGSKKIAAELGCDPKAVRMALRRHGIERPLAAAVAADRRLTDKRWLQHRYEVEGLSSHAVAAEIGCAVSTVIRWLQHHKIDVRSRHEAAMLHRAG